MTFKDWVPIITALVSVFGASGVALLTAFLAKRARKDALAVKLVEAKLRAYESVQGPMLVCIHDLSIFHTSQQVRVASADPANKAVESFLALDNAVKANAHLLSVGYLEVIERLRSLWGQVLGSSGKADQAWADRLTQMFALQGELVNEIRKDLGTDALGQHVLSLLGQEGASALSQKVDPHRPEALPLKTNVRS